MLAANQAGMQNALVAIGFTQAGAALEVVTYQGYDSLDTLAELTDATISDLISTVRKPGGTIANPAAPPIPPRIPNPGLNVGHRATTNLKLAAFVAHFIRTSRPMNNPVATLAANNLCSFVGLKNVEDAYTEPDGLPIIERIERIRDHIENIDAHLLKTLGMARVPLSYVV
jgi:hypothetical protein